MFIRTSILGLCRLAKRALNLVLPNLCFGCRQASEDLFCSDCFERLPMPASTSFDLTGSGRLTIFSAIPYNDFSRGLIHAKFTSRPGTFERAASLLVKRFGTQFQDGLVCHIPSHWTRKMVRGFDQAQVLAQGYCSKAYFPYVPLLVRCRRTENQSTQTSFEGRKRNLKNAFCINPAILSNPTLVSCLKRGPMTVIIVDDLLTSGATIRNAASAILKEFNQARVIGLCLAKTL